MNKEAKAITPDEAGLSIEIISGPRGAVKDDWPCIEFTIQLMNARRVEIWRGEYSLGVGHVKNPTRYDAYPLGLTQDETYALNTLRMKPSAQLKDKQLWANTAAKLAAAQKVAPKLNDVCHSLISNGAAFFDGQRFEDWASDLGYDPDSRKAENTFRLCDEIGRALSRHLSRDQIDGLREWASNY